MQVLELSDHPGAMLREARQGRAADAERERLRFEDALAQHHERVSCAIQDRDRARAERHSRAWLRGIFAVRREQRRAPAAPRPVMLSSDQESILTAGVEGELLVAAGLGRALGDEWTLVRGYRNSRGEIDHLLNGSQMANTADERAQLERLIARDHRYHEKRRSH